MDRITPASAAPAGGALTFLVTDVEGSTALWEREPEAMSAALARHDAILSEGIERHGGRTYKKAGDAFHAAFARPADALAAAASLQEALRAQAWPVPIRVRMALHAGEAQWRADDWFGPPLNVVARLLSVARGGQTLLTGVVAEAAGQLDAGRATAESHGCYRLKGVEQPVEVFELRSPGGGAFEPPPDTDTVYRVFHDGERWRPARTIRSTLPAERDPFVGRAADLQAIARRLDAGARLLTLLGPGGTGKTRLALHYGHAWLGDWPGGVWFCDLAEASSLDGIHYAVASGLGARLGAGDAAGQLGDAIAGRGRCLVVLDNFEQVVEHAAATVGRWYDDAPEAAFIVTSRERLGLAGEALQPVEPLPLDGPAIELFVVRARARCPDFAPDDAGRAIVAGIVTVLDGLPLAIELAAARIPVLSPTQLLARLRDRFRVLAAHGGTSRWATLRAAIDWSWQLLTAWEQAALAQCSVFEGGFTLAAAEAVLDLADWHEAPPVVDAVQALIDKSLLRRWVPAAASPRHQLDEPYFGMYLSIHEYAAEKRRLRGEACESALLQRHGRYFAGFGTDEAIDALAAPGGRLRYQALRQDLDNVVAACRRAAGRTDGETAVACYRAAWEALALQGPFDLGVSLGAQVLAIGGLEPRLAELAGLSHAEALVRTGLTEGLEARLQQSLDRVRGIGEPKLEGRIHGRLGNLCLWEGRLDEALAHYAAALERFRLVGARLLEARMRGNLAIVRHEQGLPAEALAHYEGALAIEREIGTQRDEAITLCNFADLLAGQGESERARATFDAALALLHELGDLDTEAVTRQQLGTFELGQGLIDDAVATLRKAVALTRELGNRRVLGFALHCLGDALAEQGDFERARAAFDEVFAILRSAPNRRSEAHASAGLAALELRQGRVAEAAARIAAAEATLREVGDRPLLADALCTRALTESARGDPGAAREALAQAGQIAAVLCAGPASGLGRRIARVRQTLDAR